MFTTSANHISPSSYQPLGPASSCSYPSWDFQVSLPGNCETSSRPSRWWRLMRRRIVTVVSIGVRKRVCCTLGSNYPMKSRAPPTDVVLDLTISDSTVSHLNDTGTTLLLRDDEIPLLVHSSWLVLRHESLVQDGSHHSGVYRVF